MERNVKLKTFMGGSPREYKENVVIHLPAGHYVQRQILIDDEINVEHMFICLKVYLSI